MLTTTALTAAALAAGMLMSHRQIRLLQKLQRRGAGKDTAFGAIAVKETEPFKVLRIQRVIHVLCQVVKNKLGRQVELGRPCDGNFRDVLQPTITRLLKYLRNIRPGPTHRQRRLPYGPESKYKRAAGPASPLFRHIVDKITVRTRLQSRIANQKRGIVPLQHLSEDRLLAGKPGINTNKLAQV